MKKALIALTAAFFLMASVLPACGPVLIGSGRLTTQHFTFANFTGIEISNAFEFKIKRSESYNVSITADDNIFDQVVVTLQGNTVRIYLKPFLRIGKATLKTSISMPQIEKLSASGASRGTIDGFNSTSPLVIAVSGASEVTGNITAGDTKIDVSGASTVDLTGKAGDLTASVSGASKMLLGRLPVNNAGISLSGASRGEINCSGRLDASVSGASRLTYSGNPTLGNVNTSGASTINKR